MNIRTWLIVSVTLNLLLAGVIAGHAMKPAHRGEAWRAAIESVAATLPEEKAALLRGEMDKARGENRERWKAMKAAREAAMDALAAEPFDANAYRNAVARVHRLREEAMDRFAVATETAATRLSQDERRRLAAAMRQAQGRR